MAKNINHQEEFTKRQSSFASAKATLEQAEKKHKEAKNDAEKKTAMAALVTAREPLRLFTALQWLELVKNPANGKSEITDDYVANNFDKNLIMLKGLKEDAKGNPGAEFIYQNYGGIVARIVQEDKHPEYKLRIVWFATILRRFYTGAESTRLLQAHWEDEVDLVPYVEAYVNSKLVESC